jgi:hypothetical protein
VAPARGAVPAADGALAKAGTTAVGIPSNAATMTIGASAHPRVRLVTLVPDLDLAQPVKLGRGGRQRKMRMRIVSGLV